MTTLRPEAYGWRNLEDGTLEPFSTAADGYRPGWGMPSFEDHFTGSSLNSAVWNTRNNYVEAQDVSIMRTGNVTVADSCVHLTTKKETYTAGGTTREYTSGYIDTIGKWSRRYGRFEFRAKLPIDAGVSRGLWPALWLRDASGSGEIDVMETIGTPNNHPEVYPTGGGYYSSSLYKVTGMRNPLETYPYWSKIFSNKNVGDGQFHVWAFEWTPDRLALFVDGIVQKEFSPAEWAPFAPGFPTGVNLRIDVFVGSSWQGYPNDTDTILPRAMSVDYIRYWTLP